jgi:hypothetical protein
MSIRFIEGFVLVVLDANHTVFDDESFFVIVVEVKACHFDVPTCEIVAIEERNPFFFRRSVDCRLRLTGKKCQQYKAIDIAHNRVLMNKKSFD